MLMTLLILRIFNHFFGNVPIWIKPIDYFLWWATSHLYKIVASNVLKAIQNFGLTEMHLEFAIKRMANYDANFICFLIKD